MRISKLLVVDDSPANLTAMRALLRSVDASVVTAESGLEALEAILEHDFDLILLDVQMPDMDGYETAALIRGNEDYGHIPIIFVSAAYRELQHQVRGYRLGAFDYVEKPVDKDLLISKVTVFLELGRARREQRRLIRELEREISERKRVQSELLRLSLTDSLTGLPNRRAFMDRAASEFKRTDRYGEPTAFAMIDIDHFKQVNDERGHGAGDEVLAAIAGLLRKRFRQSDALGRVGGEEFAVVFTSTAAEEVEDALNGFREDVERAEIETSAGVVTVTVSAGLTEVRESDDSFGDVMRRADEMLYRSKREGRNRLTVG